MTKVKILYNEIQKEESTDGETIESKILYISSLMSESYRNSLGQKNICFDLPLCRAVYIYKYYELHSQLTRMSLRLIKDKNKRHEENRRQNSFDSSTFLEYLKKRQRENRLVVTSIGGGPGADLEGFYRFWSEDVKQRKANITLKTIDCYEGWRECYESFMSLLSLNPDNYTFDRINVFTQDDSAFQAHLGNSDLVIMCRFLSAVYFYSWRGTKFLHQNRMNERVDSREATPNEILTNEAFRKMLRSMKSGAYFLLIDNMFRAWNNECLERMKNILGNDDEFTLLLDYGNSQSYHITLEDDLKQKITEKNETYAREIPVLNPKGEQRTVKTNGVGFQLWRRIETATAHQKEIKCYL